MTDLRSRLVALRGKADAEMRGAWDRSLPFADSLFDRWGRAQELGFGGVTPSGDATIRSCLWAVSTTYLPSTRGGSLELRDEDADKIWLADKRHNGRLTDQRLGAQGLGKLARRHHLITWVRLLWPGHDCDYR